MLYVAIGRNVGDVPMDNITWSTFRELVEECVIVGENLFPADTLAFGESRYGDMSEETAVLVWFDKMSTLKSETVEALTYYAKEYGQECIAWSVAPTNFTGGV